MPFKRETLWLMCDFISNATNDMQIAAKLMTQKTQAMSNEIRGIAGGNPIAVVLGDDVSAQLDTLRAAGVTDMESGGALPAQVASANAYLGAFPIAQALAGGADVVITGRCADSSMATAGAARAPPATPTQSSMLSTTTPGWFCRVAGAVRLPWLRAALSRWRRMAQRSWRSLTDGLPVSLAVKMSEQENSMS
jgi:hypothetical protein